MKYYINKNKEISGFELDGSQDHLITEDMKPISLEEIEVINQAKVDEYTLTPENQIQSAKQYLTSTDFYMTVDKYATLASERQVELTTKRAEARELINTLEIELQGAK